MKWTLPNIAINPGEDIAAVLAAHREELSRIPTIEDDPDRGQFTTRAQRDKALADFDRLAAGLPGLLDGSDATFTFIISGGN